MSSIDRISINRPEPDQSLADLRKREVARRNQLQLRGTTRLLLSSLEEQSQVAANRSKAERKARQDSFSHGATSDQTSDSFTPAGSDLSSLASEAARAALRASSEVINTTTGPRFVGRKQWASIGPTAKASDGMPNGVVIPPANLPEALRQIAPDKSSDGRPELFVARDAAAASAADRVQSEMVWSQRSEAASMGNARQTASESLAISNALDQLLQEVQEIAARSEPLNAEVLAKLAALGGIAASPSAKGRTVNADYVDGSYRFLGAFVETMENGGAQREAVLSALQHARVSMQADNAGARDLGPIETLAASDAQTNANDDVAVNSKHVEENVPALQDRQALYEYLEALSAAASASSVTLSQIAEIRKRNPEAALQRLVVAGDQSVALYTDEISRRLESLSERVQKDSRNSVRQGMLTDAIALEKQHMQSAIEDAESVSSYIFARKNSYDRDEALRAATTLPQIILQKT